MSLYFEKTGDGLNFKLLNSVIRQTLPQGRFSLFKFDRISIENLYKYARVHIVTLGRERLLPAKLRSGPS